MAKSDEGDVIQVRETDIATEPGMGLSLLETKLRQENMRLRRERNDARAERDDALEALERMSMPPTRKQVAAQWGKWGILVTLLPTLGVVLAQLWPDYADLIKLVTGAK